MKTILIPTIDSDFHAASVELVLKEMGHRPIRWFCQDLPEAATASCFIGRDPLRMSLRERSAPPVDIHDVDVFWHRRVGDPNIQDPEVEPSDRLVALGENKRFLRGLMRTISDRVFSVNDYTAALAAESKLLQLHAARELGFTVPETLMSSDPEHIKAFLREHEDEGAIFKAFRPVVWDSGERAATVYTHEVTLDILPADSMLQLSPGIFQARVPKAFEVRMTCMGAEQFAVVLDSQTTEAGALDWRLAPLQSLPIAPMEVPPEIAQRCRALMKRLGLVFGCFDLIVTPAGDYVFLEINQMGQFLWIEEQIPDLPLLQAFCEFLVSRDSNFRYTSTRHRFPLAAIHEQARAMVASDIMTHVLPAQPRRTVRE